MGHALQDLALKHREHASEKDRQSRPEPSSRSIGGMLNLQE
jgi:hypothetical protein